MKFFISIIMLICMMSCESTPSTYRPGSTGTPYEVFVIATTDQWKGAAGDSLRSVLTRDVEMLNQSEPFFTVRHVTKVSLSGLIAKHRNLISFRISDTVKRTHISADYNITSDPQVVVYLNSPSEDSLALYLHDNGDKLIHFLDKIEQDRFVARMKKHPSKNINEFIKKTFDFDVIVPHGYTVRSSIDNYFAWLSYEMPFISQGVVIYTYPFTPDVKFSIDYLVEKRNEFVANIPGALEGSYMITSEYVTPVTLVENINGRKWIEMKGFWDVKNDFMGGPFVSYTTVDKLNSRVITIDMYVYSPSTSKGRRNYIKQLEALVETVKIGEEKDSNAVK